MMIKDLSTSKELDSKALTEVRGGGQFIGVNTNAIGEQNVFNGGLGAAVGQQETTATSLVNATNFEDYSTKVEYGLPYWGPVVF